MLPANVFVVRARFLNFQFNRGERLMRRATRIAICLAIGFSPVDFARPGLGQVTLKHKFHEGTTSTVETRVASHKI